MQSFDALTIKAILSEAKPTLINCKVDKVIQFGRDEIVIYLRSRSGVANLLISAQAAFGRIGLIRDQALIKEIEKESKKNSFSSSGFSLLLRKHLTGATLVQIEQLLGERIVDFIFSCTDEVGTPSIKTLTAEIMGRHSNLIFWNKQNSKIITASHNVNIEMSREREITPGLDYQRPPVQDKTNIFEVDLAEFSHNFDQLIMSTAQSNNQTILPHPQATIEQWLIKTYAGISRHLAEEIVCASEIPDKLINEKTISSIKDNLWKNIEKLQEISTFKPTIKLDLSKYSVLSWCLDTKNKNGWKAFTSVNEMVEKYFYQIEIATKFHQLRQYLLSELSSQSRKLESRLNQAREQTNISQDFSYQKKCGDLILTNIHQLKSGQTTLICPDLYCETSNEISIELNPNLSPAQNAQSFYRRFTKMQAKYQAARAALRDAESRLRMLHEQLTTIRNAQNYDELNELRNGIANLKPNAITAQSTTKAKKKKSLHPITVTSSDGWKIYAGRNRTENEQLLNKLAKPQDLWFHVLGLAGSHVIVQVPSAKQQPPLSTIKEAAQVAARLSRAPVGVKVRVVYTQCCHVKKLAKEKPGMVHYENEKTIEIDTAVPISPCLQSLF